MIKYPKKKRHKKAWAALFRHCYMYYFIVPKMQKGKGQYFFFSTEVFENHWK